MNSPLIAPLIDSHCHLNYDYSPKTVADLVREANEAGVNQLVTVGTEIATIPDLVRISESHSCVFHTVGVHPHDTETMKDEDIAILETAARQEKCRAIGEIGLDYYYNHSSKDAQIRHLERQLDLAVQVKLPVVIHSRDAEDDLIQSLRKYAKKIPAGSIPGVIHCFTGTEKFALECVELGFRISFSGILTFKTAENLRQTAQKLPLDRILVETDSPYLAPIPMRGKKCEPSMVRFTALKLAEVRGIPFEELAKATSDNTRQVFKLN